MNILEIPAVLLTIMTSLALVNWSYAAFRHRKQADPSSRRRLASARAISVTLLVVSVGLLTITGISARVREIRILKVTPGMHRSEVERLLGPGAPDVSRDILDESPIQDQYSYPGNNTLWYGRLEDSIVVRYSEDRVSSTTRIGL